MNQQTWGHKGYQDGYQDIYQDLRQQCQAGTSYPAAKETPATGDGECNTAKSRARRPPGGRHQSADLSVRNLVDRGKDDEHHTVEMATTPPKQKPRSKPKRPDVAIYVPRGRRRQQEQVDVSACPPEPTAEPRLDKPVRKSAVRNARRPGPLSVPRMRRPQAETTETQDTASVVVVCSDVPPEGATLKVAEEDSLGDDVKHKTKRKKENSKTLDEKTIKNLARKVGKKKRKDGLEQVALLGETEIKDGDGSTNELHRLHSHDASASRSTERVESSLPVEFVGMSCNKAVEPHDALQTEDVYQLQHNAIIPEVHAETIATEEQQLFSDADRLPGNQATDGSHDLAGGHIGVAIPAEEAVECTGILHSCSEQMEPKPKDTSCLVYEDMSRNISTSSRETVTTESGGKEKCEGCVPDDVAIEPCAKSCATYRETPDSSSRETSLEARCAVDMDLEARCAVDLKARCAVDMDLEARCAVDVDSHMHGVVAENVDIVEAASECRLSVCLEKTLQGAALTADGLTASVSDSGGCVKCDGSTSENSDAGDISGTHDRKCCDSDVEVGGSPGTCTDIELVPLEGRLKCEHEDDMPKRENDVKSNIELAGSRATDTVCRDEREKCEHMVCDGDRSESKMDMNEDLGACGSETDSNIQSENSIGKDEHFIHRNESDNDEAKNDETKSSTNDETITSTNEDGVMDQSDVKSKTERENVEKLKRTSDDISPSLDNAGDLHQDNSVVMDTDSEEDDSWDKLFDDTGEALDPKVVEELTVAVGKVKVQKPQFDYLSFQPKELVMDDDEYSHLVEIYDFPPDLITRDLMAAFREYKDQGFDIKWVDDSHAIGIFSSSIAAHGALAMSSPFMKVRAISQATRATKVKAKHCTEFLQPYKERPETNASVARSLVAGALGLATRVPKEQRDAERKRLREARAKKKQAKQQVVDVWEGKVGGCAMDEV